MNEPGERYSDWDSEADASLDGLDVPDHLRSALRRCLWLGGGTVVLAVAAILSLPGYYNELYGPFVLSADKLAGARGLQDFGWDRYFEADIESFEDTGWYQFLSTQETFTRVQVSAPPQKYYLLASLGPAYLAVESDSRDTRPRHVAGTLYEVPPKLHTMLEQVGSGAPIPRFFLQERTASRGWAIELAVGGLLGLWLVSSLAKALVALYRARGVNVKHHSSSDQRLGR